MPEGFVKALHKLALAVSFAVMALPAIVLAFITLETLAHPLGGYRVAYVAWWVGLASFWCIPGLTTLTRRQQLACLVGACVGGAAVAWHEVTNFADPKRIFPPGFFLAPYMGAVAFAWLCGLQPGSRSR